jgi:hypothetical protein
MIAVRTTNGKRTNVLRASVTAWEMDGSFTEGPGISG